MSYLALYREFRPQTFDEVVGQQHIVETLKNQIITKKIGHAYLFCGTRGTGKTSCAKIFARAVNCLSPKNGSPCGECEICKTIQTNGNLDIVEIDAASNNGVDQIRDLREKVNFLPSVAKYKVYIIDEVHMLTESAFNALLKTLEEPPEHVIFILATTEPEKIPATILSRCMRFDFKLIDTKVLASHLKNIFNKIGIKYEDSAVELIAKAGKGSVRDTLSIAELCKSYSENVLTSENVAQCLGYTDSQKINNIANAILQKNGQIIVYEIENLYKSGKNLSVLIDELCDYFKNILITKVAPEYDLNVTDETLQEYKALANAFDQQYLVDILRILSVSAMEIKNCVDEKSYILSILIGLFYNQNLQIENLKTRISKLEIGMENLSNYYKNNEILVKNQQNLQKNDQKAPNFEQITQNLQSNQNVNSNKKTALEIFGELIKYTRESGEQILHQSFGDVKSVKIENQKFVFICTVQDCKNIIENRKEIVLNFLKSRYNINEIGFEIFVDKDAEVLKQLNNLLDGKIKVE